MVYLEPAGFALAWCGNVILTISPIILVSPNFRIRCKWVIGFHLTHTPIRYRLSMCADWNPFYLQFLQGQKMCWEILGFDRPSRKCRGTLDCSVRRYRSKLIRRIYLNFYLNFFQCDRGRHPHKLVPCYEDLTPVNDHHRSLYWVGLLEGFFSRDQDEGRIGD